ncbi:hypothetical protein FDB42_12570 [Clostridium botulinum]|nr:hypothetical protein [Clostridium botulinum]NFO40914.1 hypothetical protein [Clostridium botulinum]
MNSDLIFIEDKLVHICDMSKFIFGRDIINEKICNFDRRVVKIPIKEFKDVLINKCITKESIEYNFNIYIENRNIMLEKNSEYMTENSLQKAKKFYNDNNTLKKWSEVINNLITCKAKPEFTLWGISDFEFEDTILSELKKKNELQKFLLKDDLEWNTETDYSESLYNIPFLSSDELFFLLLEKKDKGNVIIDVTDRLNNMDFNAQEEFYKRKTFHRAKFEEEYNKIIVKIENLKDDDLTKKMFLSHLITMFESYIRNVIRVLVNNKDFYVRAIVENEYRFYGKKRSVSYKELFKIIEGLKKQINKFINENSFQSKEIITNYLINIFKVYKNEDENDFKEFIEVYEKIIKKRNIIIHSNGSYKDGRRIKIETEDLKSYYLVVRNEIEKIDRKVFISLCYM